jgi:hypothetical protein
VTQHNILDKLGPPFAFTIWVAARLLLVHSSTIEHSISQDVYIFLGALSEMGRHWKVAERYAMILKRVLDEQNESQRLAGGSSTPSTVRILADMRRCAYDLDLLISRQPRRNQTQVSESTNDLVHQTPPVNEMEYLDVFDFFNLPKFSPPSDRALNGEGQAAGPVVPMMDIINEFNITNFTVNADCDWLS